MANAANPVELGVIKSLARPGGNVTGVSFSVNSKMSAKGLQLLKEALPNVRRVAILSNPANPAQLQWVSQLKAAAGPLGLQLHLLEAREPSQFDGAFAASR